MDLKCPGNLVCNEFERCVAVGDGNIDAAAIYDATVDGPPLVDAAPLVDGACEGAVTFPVGSLDPCSLPTAGPPLSWTESVDIDTSLGTVNDELVGVVLPQLDGGGDVLVIVVESLSIDDKAKINARGDRPLAVITTGNIDIAGELFATASLDTPGAGGNHPACGDGSGSDGQNQSTGPETGGGGGGGGGFGSAGGTGGPVDRATTPISALGGTASGAALPLRGGCKGGNGGLSNALGGGGGGAIQLSAGGTITVSGRLSVSGGGGRFGPADFSGGGGGGSGGALVLQATSIDLTGSATANGGGGGEGSIRLSGFNHANGQNGSRNSATPAAGGNADGTFGGPGGNGAYADVAATNGLKGLSFGPEIPDGGGGGGGGVGIIVLDTQALTGTGVVSPPASTP